MVLLVVLVVVVMNLPYMIGILILKVYSEIGKEFLTVVDYSKTKVTVGYGVKKENRHKSLKPFSWCFNKCSFCLHSSALYVLFHQDVDDHGSLVPYRSK